MAVLGRVVIVSIKSGKRRILVSRTHFGGEKGEKGKRQEGMRSERDLAYEAASEEFQCPLVQSAWKAKVTQFEEYCLLSPKKCVRKIIHGMELLL